MLGHAGVLYWWGVDRCDGQIRYRRSNSGPQTLPGRQTEDIGAMPPVAEPTHYTRPHTYTNLSLIHRSLYPSICLSIEFVCLFICPNDCILHRITLGGKIFLRGVDLGGEEGGGVRGKSGETKRTVRQIDKKCAKMKKACSFVQKSIIRAVNSKTARSNSVSQTSPHGCSQLQFFQHENVGETHALKLTLSRCSRMKHSMYAVSADIGKAFDTVPRSGILSNPPIYNKQRTCNPSCALTHGQQ